jgi:hypothetical protein
MLCTSLFPSYISTVIPTKFSTLSLVHLRYLYIASLPLDKNLSIFIFNFIEKVPRYLN